MYYVYFFFLSLFSDTYQLLVARLFEKLLGNRCWLVLETGLVIGTKVYILLVVYDPSTEELELNHANLTGIILRNILADEEQLIYFWKRRKFRSLVFHRRLFQGLVIFPQNEDSNTVMLPFSGSPNYCINRCK